MPMDLHNPIIDECWYDPQVAELLIARVQKYYVPGLTVGIVAPDAAGIDMAVGLGIYTADEQLFFREMESGFMSRLDVPYLPLVGIAELRQAVMLAYKGHLTGKNDNASLFELAMQGNTPGDDYVSRAARELARSDPAYQMTDIAYSSQLASYVYHHHMNRHYEKEPDIIIAEFPVSNILSLLYYSRPYQARELSE